MTNLKDGDVEQQKDSDNNYGARVHAIAATVNLLVFITVLIMMSVSFSSEKYPPSMFTIVSGVMTLFLTGYHFVRFTYNIIDVVLEKLDAINALLKKTNQNKGPHND